MRLRNSEERRQRATTALPCSELSCATALCAITRNAGQMELAAGPRPVVHSDVTDIEKQLANLTAGSTFAETCTETPVKKKKKKVKVKGDKPAKKRKKRIPLDSSEGSKNALADAIEEKEEEEPIDSNEPTKIRFRRYGVQDFKLVTLLGTGGFGKVYLCKLVAHNAYFAVKFMEKRRIEEHNDYDAVLVEKKVMLYGNSNPFICKLFCAFQTTSHLCFAMEFCCGGDLRFHLDREKRFPIDKVRFYLVEIICAIRFMHRLGFIYRDLKLDNVMIASDGHCKLVDFGLCVGKIYRQEMMPSDFCGTIECMAPEVIKAHRYNQSVDYWSLGIVAYEMSVGGLPFTGTDEDEICWSICNLNVTFPCFLDMKIQSLISQLLVKNAEERLGMPNCIHGKITEHVFFGSVDWLEAEQGRLCPPYVPNTKSARDTSHFEDVFTSKRRPCFDLGDCPSSDNFANFEYTNPYMTD